VSAADDARTGIRDAHTGTPVDAAILLWADWSTGRVGRSGCSSPAAQMMLAKKLGVVPHGTASIPEMPTEAVVVDALVARLERKLCRPFKVYYLQWAPLYVKAKACGFGTNTDAMVNHVKRARAVISEGFNPGLVRLSPRRTPPRGVRIPALLPR
jgi:hypothetical protein